MKITLDTDVIKNSELTVSEFLLLLSCYLNHPITNKDALALLKNDYILCTEMTENLLPTNYSILKSGIQAVEGLIAESSLNTKKEVEDFDKLAEELINLYPKGRKEGTNYMWRDSKVNISRRLKTLAVKHGISFTPEQAIQATKKYVESFNGYYKYMHLLKYFIYKTEIKDGVAEFSSELASFIENEGQEDEEKTDWLNTLL